ncbi:MAG: flagellar hook-basal body complex protein [Verrucomicrobiota bacterium JB022]|nr:flagellar hook-basal body complex protein [Verrucomicrobiota bacterium JB022]
MALLASLNSGVSALNSFSRGLEVIGDNIANVNTVGFKGSRADFADTFSQYMNRTALAGGQVQPAASQIGFGVGVSQVSQDFGQGYIDQTGKSSDVAIAGNGFFKVVDPNSGKEYATRQGDFIVSPNGNLTTSDGFELQGLSGGSISYQVYADSTGRLVYRPLATTQPTAGVQSTLNVSPDDLSLTNGNLFLGNTPSNGLSSIPLSSTGQPFSLTQGEQALGGAAAGSGLPVGSTYTSWQGLENAILGQRVGESQFDAALTAQNAGAGLQVGGQSYQSVEELRAALSAGTVTTTEIDTALAGADTTGLQARYRDVAQLRTAVEEGVLSAADINTALAANPVTLDGTVYNGAATAGYSQFDGLFKINPDTATTYTLSDINSFAPQVVDYEIDVDGKLDLVMSDGQRFERGAVRLLRFTDPQALNQQGNGLYSNFEGAGQQGAFLANTPSQGSNGQLLQGHLERSNVDLTSEFARMITMQRSFQAGSRIITVSDEILNEAVNLKR